MKFINTLKSTLFLNIAFVISLAIIFFTVSITYKHIEELNKTNDLVIKSYDVKLNLEHLMSELKDAETGFRGYLLYKDSVFLKPYVDSRANVEKTFSKIKDLTRDNQIQQENLNELYELIAVRYYYFKKVLNTKKDYEYHKEYVINSKKSMDNIRKKSNEIDKLEDYVLLKRQHYLAETSFYTPFYALLLIFVMLFLIVVSYIKINKDLTNSRRANNRLLVTNESQKQAEIIGKFGNWEMNFEKGTFQFSDNLYRLLKYEPQEFEANLENYLKVIHPDDLEDVKKKFEKTLIKTGTSSFNYRVITKKGQTRYFSVTTLIIENIFGKKTLIGTTQDITEQHKNLQKIKKTNQELVEYNKQLTIYEESTKQAEILGNYASWILNFETLQFAYSDNKFRMLGCEPQSFDPTIENLIEFIHPDDRHIFLEGYEKIIKKEELSAINYRVIRKDGKIRNFRKSAKMYIDSLGNKNVIGTTQDVTDDVNRAYILNQKNQELERSNKELIEFNYAASHDLQEPLRKIQTFISRINEKEVDNFSEKGKEYMSRIVNAATRMRILIDDLLQYSRTNKSDAIFEEINLNEILANATQDLSEIILENDTTINSSNLPNIKAIPFQMQQLFMNLISNSIKYRKSDVAPIIDISYEKVKAKNENIKDTSNQLYHKITFSDNGIGFEQEHAEKIFLLFNRLHGKTDYPGTGVGLAICKKIISNHNGYIQAVGKPNEGATIIMYIPVDL